MAGKRYGQSRPWAELPGSTMLNRSQDHNGAQEENTRNSVRLSAALE